MLVKNEVDGQLTRGQLAQVVGLCCCFGLAAVGREGLPRHVAGLLGGSGGPETVGTEHTAVGVQVAPQLAIEHPGLALPHMATALAKDVRGQLEEEVVHLKDISVDGERRDASYKGSLDGFRRAVRLPKRPPVDHRRG